MSNVVVKGLGALIGLLRGDGLGPIGNVLDALKVYDVLHHWDGEDFTPGLTAPTTAVTSLTVGTAIEPPPMPIEAAAVAHGLVVGDLTVIAGAVPASYNGIYEVFDVGDADHFSYWTYGDVSVTPTGTITSTKVTSGMTGTVGGVYDDSVADLLTRHIGMARLTKQRALHVNLRDAAGNEAQRQDGGGFAADFGTVDASGGVYDDALGAMTASRVGTARITKQRAFHVNLRDSVGNEATGGTLLLDYDGAGNVIYMGKAVSGSSTASSVWQVRKLTYDGTNHLLSIKYSNGSLAQNAVYDDRATLSYS